MDQKRKSNSLEDKITAMVEETEAIPPTPFNLIIPIITKPMLNSPKAWMHMSLKQQESAITWVKSNLPHQSKV